MAFKPVLRGLAALMLMSGAAAHAQGSKASISTSSSVSADAASGSSVATEQESALDWMRNNMTVSYTNWFYGSSANDPLNGSMPGKDGKESEEYTPINMVNRATLGFKTSATTVLSANYESTFQATGKREYVNVDPFLRFQKSKLMEQGRFSLDADLRFYAPVEKKGIAQGRLATVRSTQYFKYSPPASRASFVLTTYVKGRAHRSGRKEKAQDLEVYAGPEVDYQITPNLKAMVLYEMAAQHMRKDDTTAGLINKGTDLEPGIVWDISKNVSLNPYLNITTGERINMGTTTVNAVLSVALI
jgi:hypothetical protein